MKTDAQWLNTAKRVHSEATSFLDSELRAQWANNIRMYNNKHPNGSRYNTELFQKRSKIFRPKTRSSGMKFEAAVATAFFSTQDVVDIAPENPGNPAQVAAAALHKNLLNYRLDRSVPWFQLLLGAAQEAWKMGRCISYQSWEYVVDDAGKVLKDTPKIELCPQENFRFSPNADWTDPVNSSPYLIRLLPMYVHEVQERIASDKKRKALGTPNPAAWRDISSQDLLAARDHHVDTTTVERDRSAAAKQSISAGVEDYDRVEIRECIIREQGQDWLFYTLGDRQLLSTPVHLEEVYQHGRPVVAGTCLLEPFKTHPAGLPELGQPVQEELNYVANDRIDNVHLVLNKRYFAKRGRNVDFSSLLRNIPGSITMMENPVEDVQVVPTPDITQSSYVEQDRLNVDFDELVGNFSQGSVSSNKALARTAGGMGMVQSGAGQITEYLIRIFTETWVEPVIRQLIKLEATHETDEVLLATAANSDQVQAYRELQTDASYDDLLSQNLLIRASVGITATNPQMKVERLLFAMDAVGKVLASPHQGKLNEKAVVSEVFGQLGYKDGAKFFIDPDGDPKISALLQENQQLQQALQSKQAEAEAKYQIDKEKLQLEVEKLKRTDAKLQKELEKADVDTQIALAQLQKLQAETNKILAGVDEQFKSAELAARQQELETQYDIEVLKNKTKRDEIIANWERNREELQTKLDITKANRGAAPSNNIMDAGKSKSKEAE